MHALHFPLSLDTETPISVYNKLCHDQSYSFLFESAEATSAAPGGAGGRYSFIGFDPVEVLTFDESGTVNPLEVLRDRMAHFKLKENVGSAHSSPFEAGFVGYFSYEVLRHFERISMPKQSAVCDIPEGVFFLPRVMVVFDHLRHTVEVRCLEEEAMAQQTVEWIKRRLSQPKELLMLKRMESINFTESGTESYGLHPSASEFEAQVDRAKEAIRAGEVFQVVLSHSMEIQTQKDPLTLYRMLRQTNPSPYLFLMNLGNFSVVGASPETLVRVEAGEVTVCPIAGTRPRGRSLEEDARLERELLADPKERAEHMMLVDLGRNDVGRIAMDGTVRVPSLARVERFSSVMHMVSRVTGRLRDDVDLFDVFQACFPAGTLSGAPKIRACELIAEIEDRRRGLYGGAVGYFGLDGTMDFAIAIRTMVHRGDTVYVQAGAGVVYDSVPRKEHEECLHKATSCISIL